MKQKHIVELRILLIILVIGVVFLFYGIFPITGNTIRQDAGDLAFWFIPYVIWSIFASLPLLYAIMKLWKIVDKISLGIFFSQDIYQSMYQVSKLIFWDAAICLIILLTSIWFIETTPGIVLICIGLAIFGFIVASFFKLLALWIQKGYVIKQEQDLTI
ncbi:MAG: DUF2975 domain-containing protein [Erysipelothrix sp.]